MQPDPRYSGFMNEVPVEEMRAWLEEALQWIDADPAYQIPLPCTGLPGLLHTEYDPYEDAAELLALGMQYFFCHIRNERKAMHNRWNEAREWVKKLEDRGRIAVAREEVDRALAVQEARDATPAFVYFIGSASGPIKIGMAVNPHERLKALQTSHHEKLTILATCKGGAKQEHAYHKLFAKHRLHGEWFRRVPAIEAEITRMKSESPVA